jgi:electron transport complex protein RnfC
VLTVTGPGVRQPKNLRVCLGTTFKEIIDQCGGLTEDAVRVVMGGPMMGLAVATLAVPAVKATSGILVLTKKEVKNHEERACIRCGRCTKVCPAGLTPNFLANAVQLKNWALVDKYGVADCIECGSCSYVCPSRIPLTQYFKYGKWELPTRRAVCQ